MQMTITDVFSYGSDAGTSQTQWHIQAKVDGAQVDIYFLDSGNNAEYDRNTVFSVHGASPAQKAAIEAWYENEGDGILRAEPGDTVSLAVQTAQPPVPPAPNTRNAGPRR